ncbi:MAG TPA: methyltransferase domain-containing protein [Isosphaeraceae bacterium]|jgi:SAM-dependent methyltransferase|nr:methyltransferase domain-containing protein [Isosphaeraceae bacterium]
MSCRTRDAIVLASERLACPRCGGPIGAGDRDWSCDDCGARFRGLLGIPDLRVADDAYLSNQDDWSFALALAEDFHRLDFRSLLDRYFDLAADIPPHLKSRQVAHILGAPGRARQWLDALGTPPDGPLLDLGCGSGSFLATTRGDRESWGVDIAMRWLVVARKRLDEEGLEQIPLVCAGAEALPFGDRTFAAVVGGDVIEHVGSKSATLAQAHRVLAPGGRLFLASPNRFSLAPEPHVQVWGVGFLPRRWMGPYVRWRRKLDFRAIHTLDWNGWRRLIRRSPFRSATIRPPVLPDGDLAQFGSIKRSIAQLYNKIISTKLGTQVALAFGPLFHVVATRPVVADPPASPATRRRPRPRPGRGSAAMSRGTSRGGDGP